ncbi:hypothetical protein RHO12_00530 [Orbus sturtevantii]|uniref:hypothetical protein n=1 Tax=Orbus sturtevantii TaxID=3074109 RepID=UPI00370D3573
MNGCEKGNEVTADYLVGNWVCTETLNDVAYYDGDKLGEFENNTQERKHAISYAKDGDMITLINLDDNGSNSIIFNFKVKQEGEFKAFDGTAGSDHRKMEVKPRHEYVFMADNEHKSISGLTFRDALSQKNMIESHYEEVCKRASS